MDVTVPPEEGDELVIVKLGYVPETEMPVPAVNATVWSGALLVIVSVSVEALVVSVTPVPADIVSVSAIASATMFDWPETAIVLNAS